MQVAERSYDVIIIGAGGAGLRAAHEIARNNKTVAVVSKVFPTRSHTVSAQGGITAALGNVHEDHWHWHMFDTVKGSDYLGDQDSIEFMCRMGPESVYELEHMGLPFSRLDNGKIYQRPFGGQSKNFGTGGQATRTSAAADRTGHALLHTLYQQNLRVKTKFYNEWFALDLVKSENGQIVGVLAMCLENGELLCLRGKAIVIATGGAGQVFATTSNAYINTGDGLGMVMRAGLPLQDMEMWQFHPTGIAGVGCLVSEGTRGEGGYLINGQGERFMLRYAPTAKDLASRDVVARAIAIEVREGRGCGPRKDYVLLKIDHLGEQTITHKLPGIRDLSMSFAGVDPIREPIPVFPTCHYMMGGIPTNKFGQVLNVNEKGVDSVVPGLYAIGECACVSVHGANRLGGNSLLDLIVFGKATGQNIISELNQGKLSIDILPQQNIDQAVARHNKWREAMQRTTGELTGDLRFELQKIMEEDFGVFRTAVSMQSGINRLDDLSARFATARLVDKSKVFNTELVEALELENMLLVAIATAHSALARTESRGAHSRQDFPNRDDKNWLKHTIYASPPPGERAGVRSRAVNFHPETIEAFAPTERKY